MISRIGIPKLFAILEPSVTWRAFAMVARTIEMTGRTNVPKIVETNSVSFLRRTPTSMMELKINRTTPKTMRAMDDEMTIS